MEDKSVTITDESHYNVVIPRYAGVPTMDLRKDLSPIMRANPKSHNFTWNEKDILKHMRIR